MVLNALFFVLYLTHPLILLCADKIMQHHRLPHERYGALVGKLLRQQPLSAADLAHGHTNAGGSLGASGSANISGGGGGSGNSASDDASAAYRHHDGEGSAASAAAAAMADTSVKRLHVNQVSVVMFLASSVLSCMSQCARVFVWALFLQSFTFVLDLKGRCLFCSNSMSSCRVFCTTTTNHLSPSATTVHVTLSF